MSDISEARQALRDYARQGHEIQANQMLGSGWLGEGIPDGVMIAVSRGEAGAKAFTAAQAALTVAEELRAEADAMPPQTEGGTAWRERRVKQAAADRIEAAILKALS